MTLRQFPRDGSRAYATVNIGVTGAPTKTSDSSPDIGITRGSAGVYDITFPGGVWRQINAWMGKSPTITNCAVVARDVAAGTAQLRTALIAAAVFVATDPANGDVLEIELLR